MSDYVIATAVAGTTYCLLRDLENTTDAMDVAKGVELDAWPDDVRFHMDPGFPEQTQLADWVKNLHHYVVVSRRLADFITANGASQLQHLPIQIVDHARRVVSTEHVLLNPHPLQDAIDKDASTLEWNPINPDKVIACEKLVLDPSRLARDVMIFRLAHMPSQVLLTKKLAAAIKAAGFTGVKFKDVDEFDY